MSKVDRAEPNHPLTGVRRTGIVEHTTNAPATVNVWIGNDSTDPNIPSVPVPYIGYPPKAGDEVALLGVAGDYIVVGVKPGDVVPGDTGWITTGLTAATNWTIGDSKYRRVGVQVELLVNAFRTNSALTASAAGNLVDTPALNLPAAIMPGHDLFTGAWSTDAISGGGRVRISDSTWCVVDAYPSQSINIGDSVNSYCHWCTDVF